MTQQQQTSTPEQKSPHEKAATIDSNSFVRRNNRGCKSEDFYNWPDQPLDDMDSPLAVQQYIQQLIRGDPSDVDAILKLPEGQDVGAWKIEHLRLFCMQLNRLATKLQDCCHPETCNQMTATEQWIFLCAAHKQPNECPAIDYTRHTLDGAASLLNSNKYFPSRVTIKESSVAKLGSVCRRVYRIFSHAYYHHYQVFEDFERETHLCKRFSKFVTNYELMSKDSLIVPSDGSRPEAETSSATQRPADHEADKAAPILPKTDLLKDSTTQESSKTESEPAKVVASSKKPEPKGEKVDDSSANPTASAPNWKSPAASTNTMVKGSTASATSRGKQDDLATKLVDNESTSKNGVESEA